MARAHVMRPITGENGDLLYGATVTVRESGLSVGIAQTLYAGPTGEARLPNPFVSPNGVLDFWLDAPQRVSVLVQRAGHSDMLVYLDGAPAPEETARTDSPLTITGLQVPGNVLLAGARSGEAVWGPPPINTGLTPLVAVINEAFALGRDPAGWNFVQAASTSRSYTDEVPPNTLLTRSLRAANTAASGSLAVISPGFTFTEPGFISLWLRPDLAAGEQVKISVTTLAGAKTVLETITGTRGWGFYRYPVAAGTYSSLSVEFTGAVVFSGTGHQVWFTGIRAVYGGQVPAHSHPGTGAGSVLLGAGAAATGVGAVAVGSASSASGTDAVAFGARAVSAGARAVGVGPDARGAADNTVAVGGGASGTAGATNWVAVGADAYVDTANGIAFGNAAKVYAVDGTAIGQGAQVGASGTNGLAVGKGAQALALNSVALGRNSLVPATHNGSVAIGESSRTSAAGQVVLGNPDLLNRSVVIANKLYALQDANFGVDASSRLGFFGSEGTVKPTVTGSDGGVLALRNAISALAGLGLITNNTTP